MLKHTTNIYSLHLFHLLHSTSLQLVCDHLSHRLPHRPLVISSPLMLSHIVSHLFVRSLSWIISCITFIISRNTITTRTLHHRITIHSSLRRMLCSQHQHHHYHHTFQPFIIHLFACPVLILHLLIDNSTLQDQNQPAMIRSLACKVLFQHVMISSLACRVLNKHVMIGSSTC